MFQLHPIGGRDLLERGIIREGNYLRGDSMR